MVEVYALSHSVVNGADPENDIHEDCDFHRYIATL
jgi:hypothetical protein